MIKHVSVSLTQSERDAADQLAAERGLSRSLLIAELIVEASPEGLRQFITSQRLPNGRPRGPNYGVRQKGPNHGRPRGRPRGPNYGKTGKIQRHGWLSGHRVKQTFLGEILVKIKVGEWVPVRNPLAKIKWDQKNDG